MAEHLSRNFPTAQVLSVGKFRLAHRPELSDKSDMPGADQIRVTLKRAMEKAGTSAMPLAVDLGLHREHINDFMVGKKQKLSATAILKIHERLGIPIEKLIINRKKGETA